jgi:hypothetical protein
MRSFVVAVLASVLLLAGSSVASAGWSVPRVLSLARSSPYAAAAVAVDSRGDAAVAWETVGAFPIESHGRRCPKTQSTPGCLPVSSLYVAARTARGRLVTRTLWSSRINPTIHLSVVLSRGQVTVTWGYYNLASTAETARVAYGPLSGDGARLGLSGTSTTWRRRCLRLASWPSTRSSLLHQTARCWRRGAPANLRPQRLATATSISTRGRWL